MPKSEKQKFLETWDYVAKDEYGHSQDPRKKSFSEWLNTDPLGKEMLKQKETGLRTVEKGNTR